MLLRHKNYDLDMEKRNKRARWEQRFLCRIVPQEAEEPIDIHEDFYELFEEVLKTLSDRDSDIIRWHFCDEQTFSSIGKRLGFSKECISRRCINAIELIRKTPFIYAFKYGKEYMELYDYAKANKKMLNALQAKIELAKIFNAITGSKDVKAEDMALDEGVKEIFASLGIDNAEELLSFSLREFTILAGAVLGDPEAKAKLEKYRTDREYVRCLAVDEVGLSKKTVNWLHRNGLFTLGDVCQYTKEELQNFSYLGEIKKTEITEKLKEYGLELKSPT